MRGDFRYRLSVTAEDVAFTPLPSEAELAIDLHEAEQRRLERTISPATCTYVRGYNLDEPSRPVSLISNVNGCWEYPDLMACANASSGPTPMLLGISMEDGMPGEARLSVASPLIVPSATTPLADGPDNGVGGMTQRLVPPVAVSLGDVSELSTDYFTVALETDDVFLVTAEPTVPMDPTCAWHYMYASLRKMGVSETLQTCVVFPDLPLWSAWDVSNVWGTAGRVSVVSFRAPTSMEVELEIVRGGECASLPPATFHVQVLPALGLRRAEASRASGASAGCAGRARLRG